MTYQPIYCTKESIGKKLRGRLNIKPNSYTNAPYVQQVPSKEVDDELVDEIIEEKENFLNLILFQLYEMPLNNQHPILKDIIESLVLSELIRIHFSGSGMTQLAGDISGSGVDTKQHAYAMLQMLTLGANIWIPGQPPAQQIPGATQPQPIRLPGEITRQNYQDRDLITNQATYINRRENDAVTKINREIDFINGYNYSE